MDIEFEWACGLTTVPSRRYDLLPRTIASIKAAGFPDPMLFIDGCTHLGRGEDEGFNYDVFELELVNHRKKIGAYGNWLLGMLELMIRNPHVDRYVMFQDDIELVRNLRQYLDNFEAPVQGYWNLYTVKTNTLDKTGFYKSPRQDGKGALALVFSKKSLIRMFSEPHLLERLVDRDKGMRNIDDAVVTSIRKKGGCEFVHNPSLVQHMGFETTIAERSVPNWGDDPGAISFPGSSFDALELLG